MSVPLGSSRDRGSRVPRVDLGVDEAVQRHRECPRSDHRDRDPDHVREAGPRVDGEERAHIGERQREHGVLDPHERRQPAGKRDVAAAPVTSAGAGSRVSPAASSRPWRSAGRRTSNPSRQPPGRPRQVDDERRSPKPGDAAREQSVRRARERIRADRLRDARRLAIDRRCASPPASRRAARSRCRRS